MGEPAEITGPSVNEWHNRFLLQSRWTEHIRRYLFDNLNLSRANCGLEVGCGTGVIADQILRLGQVPIFGIDIRADFLHFAVHLSPELRLAQANAGALPFAAGTFDFAFCHYFLLWIADPVQILRELRRVMRQGGIILALAEPDYGGRIDYPDSLARIAQLQAAALRRQGANPETGRCLASYFRKAGLGDVHTGVLGGEWQQSSQAFDEIGSEWAVLQRDLAELVSSDELEQYRRLDLAAREVGERVLFIPTFFAWGHS